MKSVPDGSTRLAMLQNNQADIGAAYDRLRHIGNVAADNNNFAGFSGGGSYAMPTAERCG